jgi:hypothetical protein
MLPRQIEFSMQNTVRQLLKFDLQTTLKILGSPNIGANIEIWMSVVRSNCTFPTVVETAEEVRSQIAALAQVRNDFVHALFAASDPGGSGLFLVSGSSRMTNEIRTVRDTAAKLSCAMAHINYCVTVGKDGPSRWSGRF